MIQSISISNYALIDKLEIAFPAGLTIITGETGAGKSILLGALGLIVGQRADSATLQDKTKKCTVEAVFDLKGHQLESFFALHDLDYETPCTIRREINPEGKSRAFINDTPVNLQTLKELGVSLIDIHSQHQTLTLSDSDYQLSVLDVYAGNELILKEYRLLYSAFKKLETEIRSLIDQENASKRDQDYFQFQFNELEAARLDGMQLDLLESELEVLTNAEEIKLQLGRASGGLNGGESNLISSLNEIKAILSGIVRFDPRIADLSERLQSAYIELKDIASELEALETEILFDQGRVTVLNERLDAVYKLFQKHQVKTAPELILLRDGFSERLLGITSLEAAIKKKSQELLIQKKTLLTQARMLSEKRMTASRNFETDLGKMLAQLGMPKALIQCRNAPLREDELGPDGQDKLTFFFSANQGAEARELSKVASGGELSRLMLGIKSLIAKKTSLPTVIFDEIDTGVSGDIADKVGTIMEQMAGGMQVITITHLPQIASKGASHLYVHKELVGQKTYTRIRNLKKDERVQEVAKMLSAGEPGPAALKNARELLNS